MSTHPEDRAGVSRRTVLSVSLSTMIALGLAGSTLRDPQAPGPGGPGLPLVPPPDPGPGEHALGTPMETVVVPAAAFTEGSDGVAVAVMVASGAPARVSIVSLRTGRRVADRPLDEDGDASATVWALAADAASGRVLLGTTQGRVYLLDPGGWELSEIDGPDGVESPYFQRAAALPDGGFLVTSYPDARLHHYDPARGTWTSHGSLGEGNDYAIGVAVRGGHAYVGTGTEDPAVFRVRLADGETARIDLPDPPPDAPRRDFVYDVAATRRHLFARVESEAAVYVRDLVDGRWVDRFDGVLPGLVAAENGEDVYWTDEEHRVHCYDGAEGRSRPLPGGFVVSRFRGGAVFRPQSGGGSPTLVTVNASGRILGWDLEAGKDVGHASDVAPGALRLRSLGVDPQGRILVSALASTGHVRRYDPAGGAFDRLASSGQVESFGVVDGAVLAGAYPGAVIRRLGSGPSTPPRDPPSAADDGGLRIPDGQDRPVAIVEAAGGLAVVATTPVYGQSDGALSVVDVAAGSVETHRGIVPGQSPLCLAADPASGTVFAGTGGAAGLGSRAARAGDGRVLAFDVRSGRVLASRIPVPGDPNIAALVLDARGRLWGLSSNAVFELDPASLDVVRVGRHSQRADSGSYVTGRTLTDGGDVLYGCWGGGIHRIDKETLGVTAVGEGQHMVRAPDGSLYYARGARLYRRVLG
ncbi:hypothetical protein ACQ3I4_04350 [Zafaria sp. Z1313]|uniref:hypothetical protein n=1 Tax=Zafaria sp. Z1313 TaxID=3423202 RepID=UPI003D303510